MSDRILINFDADTSGVERGADDIDTALDKTERSLEKVGDAGADAGEKASDGLRDTADAADEASSSVGDLPDAFEKAGSEGGDVVDSLTSGLLGVAGVAGGVGGIVSQAFGGAVDFVKGKIDEQIKAAQELRDNLVGAYKEAAAAGDVYLSQAQIIAAAQDIIFDSAKLANAKSDAAAIGVDVNTYIKAQAGDYEALKVVIDAAKQAEADRRAEGAGTGSKSEQAAAVQEVESLQKIVAENEKLAGIHKENQAAAQLATDLQVQLGEEERSQIQQTRDAEQARYEAQATALAALGKPIVVPVDADTSAVETKIGLVTTKPRRVTIVADVVDRNGRPVP